jgi:hypothetical protein
MKNSYKDSFERMTDKEKLNFAKKRLFRIEYGINGLTFEHVAVIHAYGKMYQVRETQESVKRTEQQAFEEMDKKGKYAFAIDRDFRIDKGINQIDNQTYYVIYAYNKEYTISAGQL